MEDWEYEARQTELQKGLASHFLQDNYNAFITLTFRSEGSVSYEYAEKTFGRFMHALRCSLFKERCAYRMPLVPVVESYPGRPLCSGAPSDPIERTHIHCCIKLPGNPLGHKELVQKRWLGAGGACGDPEIYCPNGEDWYIPLYTPVLMRKYVNYSLKQCCSDHQPVLWNFARKIRTA
ncbi:hypothetical protein [Stenotrophomonas acidaminiphila]|uniref:hypothetical protein n=1 Tax=Stenotrophomonas acidaminiphila TaxID=128780 RepID=UPI0028A5CC56|nr:hypothetical protein [Stenotrophomonas acidaminiphila]